MTSSIKRIDMDYGRRAIHEAIGNQGEYNVYGKLAEVYGERKISYGASKISEGTNGYPDLVLKLKEPIAIEVKSMVALSKHHNNYRFNTVKEFLTAWAEFTRKSKNKRMKRIMIVEIRTWMNNKRISEDGDPIIYHTKGEDPTNYVYFWLDSPFLDKRFENTKAKMVFHIGFWDIIRHGHKLEFTGKDFESVLKRKEDFMVRRLEG